MLSIFLCFALLTSGIADSDSRRKYKSLDEILDGGVTNKVYPGAVGVVGNLDGLVYGNAVGRHSYDKSDTTMKLGTIFDLASLTKVVSTTSAVALLYQNGYLGLDTNIGSILGNAFMNGGKENITVLNCLLHNAGFAPDPVPWYWDPTFGCPNTAHESPEEDFSCLDPLIYSSFLTETLVTPPGEAYVYSDLSFITLQMVVGTLVLQNKLVPDGSMAQCLALQNSARSAEDTPTPQERVCAFEAFVRTEVFHRPADTGSSTAGAAEQAWMPSTGYLPAQALWPHCAPTLNDTGAGSYTHKRLQGQVADGDCYAMGGIAGHAGVFSTAPDVATLARYYLSQTGATQGNVQHADRTQLPWPKLHSEHSATMTFLNATTVKLFTTVHNTTQSSRALGWSTNSPLVKHFKFTFCL